MQAALLGRLARAADRRAGLVVALPEYVVAAFAGFCLGPMILLLANCFIPLLAVLLGLIGAGLAVLCYGRPAPLAAAQGAHRWTLWALLFVLVWTVVNCCYASQDVFAIRDPSTYMIAGRWLWDHHSLRIDTTPQVFGMSRSSGGVVSGGFSNLGHTPIVYAQGNHLLPVLLALTGRMFGLQAMFAVNVVFAGLGLFVLFGLAHRVSRSGPMALVVTAALAVSIPYLYVSRDTYTEPLTMLFLMGGLLLLLRAWQTRSPRQFGLASFVACSSAMARVDSYAALYGLLGAAAVLCVVAAPQRRRHAARCAAAMYVGGVLPTLAGWLDVAWLSRQYYWSQNSNITALLKVLVALSILVPVLAAGCWSRPVQRLLRAERTRPTLTRWLTILTLTVFLLLLSRPLWYNQVHDSYNPVLAQLQQRSGVKVDGTATYGQLTLNWQAWYFGWATVALAAAGYLVLLRRLLAGREYGLSALLGTGLALSALYLWNPEIYPDQPWAMRRFVPVVLPVLLVAAAVALNAVVSYGRARGRRSLHYLGWLLAAVTVIFPLVVTAPVWTLRQEYPQYLQLSALCRALPADAAVIEVDADAQIGYAQSLRSFCHVPTYALIRQAGQDDEQFRAAVAAVYASTRASGYRLYALSVGQNVAPVAPGASAAPFSEVHTYRWSTLIGHVPSGPVRTTDVITVNLSLIDAAGYAHPITGGPVFTSARQQKQAGY